jgi:hypothetical protein
VESERRFCSRNLWDPELETLEGEVALAKKMNASRDCGRATGTRNKIIGRPAAGGDSVSRPFIHKSGEAWIMSDSGPFRAHETSLRVSEDEEGGRIRTQTSRRTVTLLRGRVRVLRCSSIISSLSPSPFSFLWRTFFLIRLPLYAMMMDRLQCRYSAPLPSYGQEGGAVNQ